jgi:hypothetical protein
MMPRWAASMSNLGKRGGVADGERHLQVLGERFRHQGLAAAGGADQQNVRFFNFDVVFDVFVQHQPLVVVVHCDGEDLLGDRLANHVLVEVVDDLPRRRNVGEELFRGAAATALLVEDRLAKVDALAADIDVFGPLDERADVAVTFAAKGTVGVLLAGYTALPGGEIFTGGHSSSFSVADRARTTADYEPTNPFRPATAYGVFGSDSDLFEGPAGPASPFASASLQTSSSLISASATRKTLPWLPRVE